MESGWVRAELYKTSIRQAASLFSSLKRNERPPSPARRTRRAHCALARRPRPSIITGRDVVDDTRNNQDLEWKGVHTTGTAQIQL
ncbi:unnamed protein product, partial [Brenthis ino]